MGSTAGRAWCDAGVELVIPLNWRSHLIKLAATITVLLALFWRDAAKMGEIWWTSSTFTHCLFILPIVGWLIWQRRDEIWLLTPRPFIPGLALVALGALGWLVGTAAGVGFVRHASLIFMIQSSVLTILGLQVTRGILFPLFYLAFLVPFGEELVPPLQTITAKLCMIFLGWAGIPAHIEGIFITTPTGNFRVAEACSGVKFLVAMFAYASLAANLCFKSWLRRALFMAVAIIVPILANGFRAYSTIHISEYTGSTAFASSMDHVIYGWFFFGFVMLVVMGLSWKFFDRKIGEPWLSDALKGEAPRPIFDMQWLPPFAVIVIALLPLSWQAALASDSRVDVSHRITLPEVRGWTRVAITQNFPWRPNFDGADHYLFGQYRNADGREIELAVALYGWQGEGRELVGYGQGAVEPESPWSWTNDTPSPSGGKAERIFAPGVAREVVSYYVLGGVTTGDAHKVKIETLKARLLGGNQAAAAVLIAAEDSKETPARPVIDAFLVSLGSPNALVDTLVSEARGR